MRQGWLKSKYSFEQVGHGSIQTTLKHYATWLDSGNAGQLAKMELALKLAKEALESSALVEAVS